MSDVERSFATFQQAFNQNAPVDQLQQQLVKLKIDMTNHGFLQSGDAKERSVARSVLEYAALTCVRANDFAGFERNVAQLQSYALDPQESKVKYEIIGINLLRLLALDKLAEFHTELELIPVAKRSDPFVQYPVTLEQQMMEGAFHKVIKSLKSGLPSQYFGPFAARLSETVRLQIAECLSRAYSTLSLKQAAELLLVSEQELPQFEKHCGWVRTADGGAYDFAQKRTEARVPKQQIMSQTLALAHEVERII